MALTKENEYGSINISNSALASVAGDSASECYGVVGLYLIIYIKREFSVILSLLMLPYDMPYPSHDRVNVHPD